MRGDIFSNLQTARRSKTPVTLVDGLDGRTQALVFQDSVDGDLPEAVVQEARERLRDNRSGVAELSDARWFFDCHNPPLRLIIVGAVHISQTLVPMAAIAGYEVVVIDPRASFATAERFPNVALMDDWPDEAMEALKPDNRTAIVTLTHDPKLDDPALEIALKSDAFYITCLGSRRTHAKRVERLKEMGFDDAAIGRIHAPAGLDIGAVSPAEIAISVLAELTAVLHAKPIVAAAA
ncbi:MAG: XdhC family protein [Thalassobaculaceae bacterium]